MLNLFTRKPKGYEDVSADEVLDLMSGKGRLQLVDVRSKGEFAQGHLKGARLIPLPELGSRGNKLDPAQMVVLYCQSGHRSARGARLLAEMGFTDVRNLQGGIRRWGGDVVR
jgi:rhodanese-related sulfurtransferase